MSLKRSFDAFKRQIRLLQLLDSGSIVADISWIAVRGSKLPAAVYCLVLGMSVKSLSQFDNVYFQAGVDFYNQVSLLARVSPRRENMTSV